MESHLARGLLPPFGGGQTTSNHLVLEALGSQQILPKFSPFVNRIISIKSFLGAICCYFRTMSVYLNHINNYNIGLSARTRTYDI